MWYILLIGTPGAGKGTQAVRLAEKYRGIHCSTGDMFRAQVRAKTMLGKQIQQFVDHGKLVPDTLTIATLEATLAEHPEAKGFILDGYPRTMKQAEALARTQKPMDTLFALHIEISPEVAMQRLQERGKSSDRTDDLSEEKIKKRLEVYETDTLFLLNYYEKQQKLHTIPGETAPETVFANCCKYIDQWI